MSDQLVSDPQSGLFSEALLNAVLPSRVATARRTLRQLGLILMQVSDGPSPEAIAAQVARAIRDSDMAARLKDGTIALVLEFTPAEGCVVVADRLQKQFESEHPGTVVRAGVACYPAHAVSAEELMASASIAMNRAAAGTSAVAPLPD